MEQKEIIAKSIDQICDMILACDQTGRIIYMNETAQKQLEYPVSDPSISIFDIFPGIFTEAKDLAETRQKAEVDRLPVDIYRYNRTCFPVWMRLLDTGNADYICIAHDRTKEIYLTRKVDQVGEEAKAAAKVKSGFVERFPELSLFFKAYSLLDSEMICIFPYLCPYAESAREIREIFS